MTKQQNWNLILKPISRNQIKKQKTSFWLLGKMRRREEIDTSDLVFSPILDHRSKTKPSLNRAYYNSSPQSMVKPKSKFLSFFFILFSKSAHQQKQKVRSRPNLSSCPQQPITSNSRFQSFPPFPPISQEPNS